MGTTNTPNMTLPVPTVGTEPGPQYATDINNCLNTIDQHNHSSGNGVAINSNGLNLTQDLPLNANNLISTRTVRFTPTQATSGTDINCVYVSSSGLYFNDSLGNQLKVIGSGAIQFASTGLFQVVQTTAISIQDGTASNPSIYFTQNTNTGIYRAGSNNLGIAAAGANSAQFTSNGVKLLGTSIGDNAPAGNYGESVYQTVSSGNPYALGINNYITAGSAILSAGDWDVTGQIYGANNGTTVNYVQVGLSGDPTNTFSDSAVGDNIVSFGCGGVNQFGGTVANYRSSSAVQRTIYLRTLANWSGTGSSALFSYRISARRMR